MNTRHIWAIGRNYKDHALEMKAPLPTEPMIFLKAGGCATFQKNILIPTWIKELHHEIELAFKFDSQLQLTEYALALDLTERHYQSLAKSNGTPWTLAKSFKNSCPLSKFIKIDSETEMNHLSIELHINEQLKQKGYLKDLIFPLPVIVDYVKKYFPVEPGDILLTGTPAGVGPLKKGDQLRAQLRSTKEDHSLIEQEWLVTGTFTEDSP